MVKASFLMFTMALGACSSAGNWVKPGADREATDAAYAQCRALAATAVRTDAAIDKDILASRGNDWQRAEILPVETARMRQNTRVEGESVTASCMAQKGFSRPGYRPPLPTPSWHLP